MTDFLGQYNLQNEKTAVRNKEKCFALKIHCVPKKVTPKFQITMTTAYLIRIKYPFSGFNYHFSDVNVANFNKIHRTVSEQQLF